MGRADGLHRRPNRPGAIWYFGYKGLDGKWHEVSTGTAKYADAVKVKAEKLPELMKSPAIEEYGKLTLAQALDSFLDSKEGKIATRTLDSYRWCAERPKQTIGGVMLKQIDWEHIEFHQREARKAGLCGRSVNMETDVIRMALKRFDHWDHIGKKFQPLREDDSDLGKAMTREQVRHMLQVGERIWLQTRLVNGQLREQRNASIAGRRVLVPVVKLLLNTGLRTCELKQLRLGHIDLLEAKLQVRRTTTKTDAGARTVPLNPDAIDALRRLIAIANDRGSNEPHHFLLPHHSSRHTHGERKGERGYLPVEHQKTFSSAWSTWMQEAGLTEFTMHDLRHTFITRCAEEGIDIELTRSIVGHMSVEMTRYYTHICNDVKLNVVRRVDFMKIPPVSAEVIEITQRELENRGQLRLVHG